MARYDAERLSVGLSRAKMFNFDDLVLTEGYFGKLFSTNAGRNWGNRQANTKLTVGAHTDHIRISGSVIFAVYFMRVHSPGCEQVQRRNETRHTNRRLEEVER